VFDCRALFLYLLARQVPRAAGGILRFAGQPLGDAVGRQLRISDESAETLDQCAFDLMGDALDAIGVHENVLTNLFLLDQSIRAAHSLLRHANRTCSKMPVGCSRRDAVLTTCDARRSPTPQVLASKPVDQDGLPAEVQTLRSRQSGI
jgi:hypothetical protein